GPADRGRAASGPVAPAPGGAVRGAGCGEPTPRRSPPAGAGVRRASARLHHAPGAGDLGDAGAGEDALELDGLGDGVRAVHVDPAHLDLFPARDEAAEVLLLVGLDEVVDRAVVDRGVLLEVE